MQNFKELVTFNPFLSSAGRLKRTKERKEGILEASSTCSESLVWALNRLHFDVEIQAPTTTPQSEVAMFELDEGFGVTQIN